MTFNIHQFKKYEVLKNDSTDIDAIVNTQKDNIIKNMKIQISNLIGEDVVLNIDANIENLINLSDKTIENINNDAKLKKCVLTYIFWKYKYNDSSKSFKVNHIKKIFNLKFNEKFETHIHYIYYKIKCPLCNKEGEIILDFNSNKRKSFVCSSCGHIDKADENMSSYTYCNCDSCKNLRKEIREACDMWISDSLRELQEFINNSPRLLDIVDDETMRKHFMIYNSTLCKDTRHIIKINPKDIDELEVRKKEISDTKFKNKSQYLKSIDNKLLDKKIMYAYLEKDNSVTAYDLLCLYFDASNYLLEKEKPYYNSFDIITKLLSDINSGDDFFENLLGFNYYRLNFETGYVVLRNFKLGLKISMFEKELKSILYQKKFMLNPYFFDQTSIGNDTNNNFKSNAEISIQTILQNKYPVSGGYVILNNPRLSDYINMIDIYDIFKEEKAKYVSKCYVDFLIIKNEIPYKVYELQKGKHHNTPDWIEKDKIKKMACLASGLKFEEYF